MYLTTPLSVAEIAALAAASKLEGRSGPLTPERNKLVALGFLRQMAGGFQLTKRGRLKLRMEQVE